MRRGYRASILRMRTASPPNRSLCAVLLSLVLAMRLLSPAGFMPAFEHGEVTIVACPDVDSAPAPAPMAHHHHGNGHKIFHQSCPYAAASAPGALADTAAFIGAVLLISAALLIGRPFAFLERRRIYDRPPLRGPPLPV